MSTFAVQDCGDFIELALPSLEEPKRLGAVLLPKSNITRVSFYNYPGLLGGAPFTVVEFRLNEINKDGHPVTLSFQTDNPFEDRARVAHALNK